MTKLTLDELAAAHDRGDFHTLWLAARPLVKFTIKRMMRYGELDPSLMNEDTLQEGMLAAGSAVRSWSTLEGAFSTWVVTQVRFKILNHMNRTNKAGFTGDGEAFAVSMEDETPYARSRQHAAGSRAEVDEDDRDTYNDVVTYPDDEVFPSPETATERANALRLIDRVGPNGAEVLRRVCGVGCEPQSLGEAALATGVSYRYAQATPDRLRRLLPPTK